MNPDGSRWSNPVSDGSTEFAITIIDDMARRRSKEEDRESATRPVTGPSAGRA